MKVIKVKLRTLDSKKEQSLTISETTFTEWLNKSTLEHVRPELLHYFHKKYMFHIHIISMENKFNVEIHTTNYFFI